MEKKILKNVDRDFPNYSKHIFTPKVISGGERGQNRKERRSKEAHARKPGKIPSYLTKEHIAQKIAIQKRVAKREAAVKARKLAREKGIRF